MALQLTLFELATGYEKSWFGVIERESELWMVVQLTGRDNIASASTISGEYVSNGKTVMHTMLKLQIIIRGQNEK